MRYGQEVRWVLIGDPNLARSYFPVARTLIGVASSTADERAENTVHRFDRDGVRFTITRLPESVVSVEIDVRAREDAAKRRRVEASIWIPEGFVLHPVNSEHRAGWGLPVVEVTPTGNDFDGQPYAPENFKFAPENLRPGLNVNRWTPEGVNGQVIVTRKANNGYAVEPEGRSVRYVDVTPTYHPEVGPRPGFLDPPTYGSWAAYRLEMSDFSANTFSLDVEDTEIRLQKREMFNLLNAHRASVGRDPIFPPLRGTFDSAQIQSDLTTVTGLNGHMVGEYPTTYKGYNPRSAKNGHAARERAYTSGLTMLEGVAAFGGDILVSLADDLIPLYNDTNGFPTYQLVGTRYLITPQVALDAWLSSPQHREYIESDVHDMGSVISAHAHIGFRRGTCTAVFERNGQWIQSGNGTFLSVHDEVPPVTWRTYDTRNLQFETARFRPVAFISPFSSDKFIGFLGADSSEVNDVFLTTPVPTIVNGATLEGYEATRGFLRRVEAGFSIRSHLGGEVYMRGRAVAIAPNAGAVLAAGVAKLDFGQGTIYRLMILAVHPEEDGGIGPVAEPQFLPSTYTSGAATPPKFSMTSCRLWWVDFANDPTFLPARLPCHPRDVARRVRGQESSGPEGSHPSIEQDSPYSWSGGEFIDVVTLDDGLMLKYDSMWTFSPDGTRAACIRSAFYADEFGECSITNTEGESKWGRLARESHMHQGYVDTVDLGGPYGRLVTAMQVDGGDPVYITLQFDHAANNVTVSRSVSYYGGNNRRGPRAKYFAFSANPPKLRAEITSTALPTILDEPIRVFRPIALYWRGGNTLRALYDVKAIMTTLEWVTPSREFPGTYTILLIAGTAIYRKALVRGPAVIGEGEVDGLLAAAEPYSSDVDFGDGRDLMATYPSVFYVSDDHLAYGVYGVLSPGFCENPTPFSSTLVPRDDTPRILRRKAGYAPPDPEDDIGDDVYYDDPCDWVPSERELLQTRLFLDGEIVEARSWSNIYGDYPWPRNVGWEGTFGATTTIQGTFAAGCAAAMFAGGFAVDRDGNWVYAVSYVASDWSVLRQIESPSAFASAFDCEGYPRPIAYAGIQGRSAWWGHLGGPEIRGGYWSSSFGNLATITDTPGESWSLYVRLV